MNPHPRRSRPDREDPPAVPIDIDGAPGPAQDVGPAFAGVLSADVHAFVGERGARGVEEHGEAGAVRVGGVAGAGPACEGWGLVGYVFIRWGAANTDFGGGMKKRR